MHTGETQKPASREKSVAPGRAYHTYAGHRRARCLRPPRGAMGCCGVPAFLFYEKGELGFGTEHLSLLGLPRADAKKLKKTGTERGGAIPPASKSRFLFLAFCPVARRPGPAAARCVQAAGRTEVVTVSRSCYGVAAVCRAGCEFESLPAGFSCLHQALLKSAPDVSWPQAGRAAHPRPFKLLV